MIITCEVLPVVIDFHLEFLFLLFLLPTETLFTSTLAVKLTSASNSELLTPKKTVPNYRVNDKTCTLILRTSCRGKILSNILKELKLSLEKPNNVCLWNISGLFLRKNEQ